MLIAAVEGSFRCDHFAVRIKRYDGWLRLSGCWIERKAARHRLPLRLPIKSTGCKRLLGRCRHWAGPSSHTLGVWHPVKTQQRRASL